MSAEAERWEQIRHLLLVRSGWRCEVTGERITLRSGWSAHHRRPRGAGGTSRADVDDLSNLLVVTGDGVRGAHGMVESERTRAYRSGWLVRQEHDPATIPVVLWSGRRVLLDPSLPIYLPAPGAPYDLLLPQRGQVG